MDLDREVCLCYHVSLRKLLNYARREQPAHASQMSECLGAGSGCGWCIPFLCQIAEYRDAPERIELELSPEEYAAARRAYHKSGARNRFEAGESPAP